MSLNNEPSMVRPSFVELNPVGFNYYLFAISLGKCYKSFNVVNDLSMTICVPSKKKDINIKVFNC